MDWTLRLQIDGAQQNLSEYLGSEKTATIMRDLPADQFTSLRLILPDDCSHQNCTEAWDNCSLTPGESEVTRLVMRSTVDRVWMVECALFNKVEAVSCLTM